MTRLVGSLLLTLLAVVACGGQTHPPAAKPRSGPKAGAGIPNTDNIESVVRRLIASESGEKKEFETTAQFEARQKAALITDRRYAFDIETYGYTFSNGPSENRCGCEYDADTETMKARIDSHAELFADPSYSTSSAVPVRLSKRRTERHVGTNSFGAKAVFDSDFYDEFGIVLSRQSLAWLRSLSAEKDPNPFASLSFSFPLERNRAKAMKPNLRVVLVGTIPDARVLKREFYSGATINEPVELTINKFYVTFLLNEVRIVDSRTGQIVANFVQGGAIQ